MSATASTNETLRAENAELRARLEEAEEVLRAIRSGEVDALMVETAAGPQLFALQGLDAQQNRFRGELLAQVSDAVIATDLHQHVTFVNAAAERLFGVRASDVLGRAFADIYNRQWQKLDLAGSIRTALQECGKWRGELIVHGNDGRELHVETVFCTLRAPDGTPTGFVAAIRDITARKEAEDLLRQSEARFEVVLKNSGILVYTTDLDLRYTWIRNPHPPFDPAEVVGHRDDELLPPEKAEPLIRLKREVLESGVARRSEFAVEFGGTHHHYDLTVEPLRGIGGKVAGLTVAAMDITDSKRRETALKVSEVRYRRLFESAKDGILILDAHAATITHANPFIAELLGYSPEEFVGKELWQIGLFKDVEASKAAMRELQEKGYIRYEDLPLETKAGRRINVEFVSNMYGEDGDIVIQCNIRDISDRKRLEESLRQHAADLSEVDRRKDDFLATLAHELRNPLAPMRNAVELLRMKGPAIPELQWARDVIDRQTQAMTRLIDDLMDISRINQGKITLKREQVELAKIVQGAVETSNPLIEEMGHELTVTLPPRPVIMDADLTRLTQVFLNLLNNAAKYTERGGRIDLRAELQGSDAVVSVTDTGIGIPADKLPTLFEMFSQVEGALSRSQGGLGIGLCLAKRLVEMHGGSIEARSGGPGKGSDFVVRLPIVVERTYPRPASHDGDLATPTSDLRILVVDDNRDAAESLAMLLRAMGNNVQTAHDGEVAVAAAGEFRPHVVLCDIGLPKLNGYEACRRMKEQAWEEKMILIAVTGWGQDDDRRKSAAAGFDHHMVKPVDTKSLMKLLAELDSVDL